MLQNLHHADFAFDRFEVNELGFLGHGNTPFKVQGMNKMTDSQKRAASKKDYITKFRPLTASPSGLAGKFQRTHVLHQNFIPLRCSLCLGT
jgi:hypothetical protein